MNKRHKWNGKVGTTRDGLVVCCVKCGMVKQTVKGFPTYFLNDTVYDKKAPPCKGNLVTPNEMIMIKQCPAMDCIGNEHGCSGGSCTNGYHGKRARWKKINLQKFIEIFDRKPFE